MKFAVMYESKRVPATNFSAVDAYYYSIVTFTTLGYGDIAPIDSMRLVFATEALVGYLFFGVLVGLIVSATLMKEISRDDGQENID